LWLLVPANEFELRPRSGPVPVLLLVPVFGILFVAGEILRRLDEPLTETPTTR